MPKLGEFVKAQAVKAGIDITAEANKAFFEALATVETDVPDTISAILNSSLISVKEAKNNHPEIKNHYTARALDGLDLEIESQATEYELPQPVKDALKLEKNSYKRAALLTKAVKEAETAKVGADKPDIKKLNDQILGLNQQIAAEKSARETDKTGFEGERKQMKMSYALDGQLGQYKTIYDNLPAGARNVGIRALLDDEFRNNGVKLDLDGDGNIVLQTKEGGNYFDPATNTPLTAKQFIERSLAKNKLLVTNDAGQGTNGSGNAEGSQSSNNQNGNQGNNNGNGNGNNQNQNRNNNSNNDSVMAKIREMNEKAVADYKAAPAM